MKRASRSLRNKRRLLGGILTAAALITPGLSHAWGKDGHRITGRIATSLLSEPARQQILDLFGNVDLASIATQLDDNRDEIERRHPGSARWHYENRSVCGTTVACPRGQCITRQIEHFKGVLADKRATHERRIEAVVGLVHLIGDLNQPLHLADNGDRGGNDFWVMLPREHEPRKLHEVWDYSLVKLAMKRRSASAYSDILLRDFAGSFTSWQQGTIESWAVETHTIAVRRAYQSLPGFACGMRAHPGVDPVVLSLPTQYVNDSQAVVAEQLAKSGVRIASVLNSAFAR
jgi:hypothetical protein